MAKQFISNKDESVRIFKNNLFDKCSRYHFLVPVFVFVPVITFFLYLSVSTFSLSFIRILVLFAIGVFTWSLSEYFLHRFIFHYQPKTDFGKRMHFLIHGVHHDYPSDSKRLIMPPPISVPLAILFYFIFYFTLGKVDTCPFFAGFITGYLIYDEMHYALHHFNFKSKFWLSIKNHHMIHHFKDSQNGFGVSSTFWDHVFRTLFKKEQ